VVKAKVVLRPSFVAKFLDSSIRSTHRLSVIVDYFTGTVDMRVREIAPSRIKRGQLGLAKGANARVPSLILLQ